MKHIAMSLITLLGLTTSYASMPGGENTNCKRLNETQVVCKVNRDKVNLEDQNTLDSLYNTVGNPEERKYELDEFDGINFPKGNKPEKKYRYIDNSQYSGG